MTITRWIPRRSLINYHNEIDNLMDSVFGTREDAENECVICPSVDIKELDTAYSVHVELPGVNKKDVSINVNKDVLTIEGEKKLDLDSEKDKLHRSERVFGKFRRSFHLPDSVDANKIDASFKDGVLSIDIPKQEEKLPKDIEIKIK